MAKKPPLTRFETSGGAALTDDAAFIMKLASVGGPYIANAITPWRGVRTKRHTYVNLLDHGPWLLYHDQQDPYQLDNLINKPGHAELQATLEKRMRELMKKAGDTDKIMAFRESRKPQDG